MPVGRAASRTVGGVVDLAEIAATDPGLGVVWTQEGNGDLNVNLVRFEAREGVGVHVNEEVDVAYVGVSGSGEVVVDGEKFPLEPGRLVYVPKGCLRETRSTSDRFAYLTVHKRRGPVRLGPRPGAGAGTERDR